MGQGVRLVLGDQCALRDRRAADTAVNGGRDLRAGQINPGPVQCRFLQRDVGLGFLGGGHGLIIFLLADRIDLCQFGKAVGGFLGDIGRGPGACQRGFGASHVCRVFGGVNLVEGLSALDQVTLLEQAFLDDAGDLRADFRLGIGPCATGQFNRVRHRDQFGRQRFHAWRGLLRCFNRRGLVATGGQEEPSRHGHCRDTFSYDFHGDSLTSREAWM